MRNWPQGGHYDHGSGSVSSSVSRSVRRRVPGPAAQPADLVLPYLRDHPDLDRARHRLRRDLAVGGRPFQHGLRRRGRGRTAVPRPAADDLVQAEVPPVVVRLEPGTAAVHQPVWTYLVLVNDNYPSTDDHQWVRLDYPYPDAAADLNRWLPLVKWLLAFPHYIVLFFLVIAAFFVVIAAWFAMLFTGRYPRDMFSFVEGVFRWHNRVVGYALTLVTDRYPPFRLAP